MIVVDQFSEIQDVQVGVGPKGEPILEKRRVSGRRLVDLPDVVTQEEGARLEAIRAATRTRAARIADIRAKMVDLLAETEAGDATAKTELTALTAELRTLKAAR